MARVQIIAGEIAISALLNDSPTAAAIYKALPLKAQVNTWGDEIYFGIPVHLQEAPDAQEVVSLGDLGYWAPGHAFCIFFGRTPMSIGNEIRPASAVNIFGHVEGDATALSQVPDGEQICIQRADS
ncbi:MAG: hypothetical protein LLG44_12765 [Chloroflexi bacterium]|nr:hypothetical protein [Chloroflexota bacterium]